MTAFDLSTFEAPLVVPELRAGPVQLRPWALSDLPLIRQAASDPYIPTITSVPGTYSDDAGRAYIERQCELANDGHGFQFVIAELSDPHAPLGALGLWLREIENGRGTIGYWIASSARGKKLAGWALKGVVAFAFDVLGIPRLQLFIEPWNLASQRTAEFAGFTKEALLHGWERIDGAQHDAFSYVLLHEEWDSRTKLGHLDA